MADKPDKTNKLKARLPRGLADRGAAEPPDPPSAARPSEPDRPVQPISTTDRPSRPDSPNPPAPPSTNSAAETSQPGSAIDPFLARETLGWRPFAAMLITCLSLPLAYWTRTAIPDAIARARASLPGPGPRRRSLPPGSGA